MAAFDRILSGIPEMDKALDNIRLGDNVVWRVSDLSEFRLFMEPYVRQAVKDKRKIIYFRFAAHEPLITFRTALRISRLRSTTLSKTPAETRFMFSTVFLSFRRRGLRI